VTVIGPSLYLRRNIVIVPLIREIFKRVGARVGRQGDHDIRRIVEFILPAIEQGMAQCFSPDTLSVPHTNFILKIKVYTIALQATIMPKSRSTTKKPTRKASIPPIEKAIVINAGVDKVWAALTDPKAIGSWMEDDGVKVSLKKGGKYVLFAGSTTGKFLEIDRPKALEYTWRMDEWDEDSPDTNVRWELAPSGKKTKVRLVHKGFVDREMRDSHDDGWDVYFLEPMKNWLESGDG